MIMIDIETSGGFNVNNGIWQIGAIEIENPSNTFLQESRIDDEDHVEKEALLVIGKNEQELRDKSKQSQKDLLINFFDWVAKIENKTFLAHNTPFDYSFISLKAKKYGLNFPFKHRSFDLHVIASLRYNQIKGNFLFEKGESGMNLSKVLSFCGLEDNRILLENGKVKKEGKPHNALEDAKLEAECFSRLVYGRGLLEDFSKYEVPEYLR